MTRPSNTQIEQADLIRLFDMVKIETKREINCHSVGTIVSFDPMTVTAVVSINYRKVLKKRNYVPTNVNDPNSVGYTDVVINYPLLLRCPVLVMNGGGAFTTYPISGGEECLVAFCDRDIDLWFEKGSTTNPPNSERMHDLSDAIVIVGVQSLKNTIPNYSTTTFKTWFGRVVMEFTNLVASIKDKHGERLVPVGTGPIPTFCQTPPDGWLFMYGQTLGNSSSGAVEASDDYEDLFNILKTVYPNVGGDFESGQTIIIPDLRGKTPITVDNLGGSQANILSSSITPVRNTLGAPTGQETINIRHNHLGATDGVTFGSSPTGIPGVVTAGALDTLHYHGITNDLSPTQTIMQPGLMVNVMIKY